MKSVYLLIAVAMSSTDLKNPGRPHAKLYSFACRGDDGTTAMKLTTMELMERLLALVPKPKMHLTRYHGVLGPHYKYRKQIVPKPPQLKLVPDNQIDTEQIPETKRKNIRFSSETVLPIFVIIFY